MRTSDSIQEITKALVAAQKEMQPAQKSGNNPHFQASYATLKDVMDAALPALNSQGIAVTQATDDTELGTGVVTRLMHTSGEWIESTTIIPVQQRTAHAVGSALMYARRYGFQSLIGLAASDDDDGETATAGTRGGKEAAAEVAAKLVGRIDAEDVPGALEIWLELNERQQEHLFSGTRYLTSKQKQWMRTQEYAHFNPPEDA